MEERYYLKKLSGHERSDKCIFTSGPQQKSWIISSVFLYLLLIIKKE